MNASAGSPPCAPGSASSGIRSRYSQNEPGQPWVSSSGSGSGPCPGACTRWIRWPSTVTSRWVSRSSRAWNAATSNCCQSASNAASQDRGTPRAQSSLSAAGSRVRDSRSRKSSSASPSRVTRMSRVVSASAIRPAWQAPRRSSSVAGADFSRLTLQTRLRLSGYLSGSAANDRREKWAGARRGRAGWQGAGP